MLVVRNGGPGCGACRGIAFSGLGCAGGLHSGVGGTCCGKPSSRHPPVTGDWVPRRTYGPAVALPASDLAGLDAGSWLTDAAPRTL